MGSRIKGTRTSTKDDLAHTVSKNTGLSFQICRETLETMLEVIVENAAEGDSVHLREFGVFNTKLKKGRWCRDIRKRQPIWNPAHRVLKFKFHGNLLKYLRGIQG